jgi:glycosyltransferase involved in cell wall biosynthesis
MRRLIASGVTFDLIDAHYFYPDGVAAVMLAREFGLPVSITARGTDLNLIPRYTVPRRWIAWAARHADGLVTVCEALKRELVELGIAPERVRVLRNGVDLRLFRPVDRKDARAKLGLTGPTLLSAGALIPRKGHDLAIEALGRLPGFRLLIVGDGPMRGELKALAERLGVADRVGFVGAVAHERLPEIYSAGDALVLASSREGWANVLLEAMACGTPVVASDVWGNGEVVASAAAGSLMTDRTPAALAEAVLRLFASPPSRAATRAYAEAFSWDATTEGQIELFEEMVADARGGRK